MDPVHLFLAAVRAVAPHAVRARARDVVPATGAELIAWVAAREPAARPILATLTQAEQEDLQRVLDGMLRERTISAAFTARPRV